MLPHGPVGRGTCSALGGLGMGSATLLALLGHSAMCAGPFCTQVPWLIEFSYMFKRQFQSLSYCFSVAYLLRLDKQLVNSLEWVVLIVSGSLEISVL